MYFSSISTGTHIKELWCPQQLGKLLEFFRLPISYHKQSGLLKTQGYHQVAIQVHSLLVVLRLNKKAILECTWLGT